MKVPDLITTAHSEPGRAETPELSLNRSLRDSKPVSLEEKIAQEHTIRRNEGRESSQTLIPTNPLAGVSLGSSLSSSPQAQLHDFIFSLALGQGKKNKGSLVGDAEIEELIRQHPELSAFIKELKQARDEALRNAEQKQQSPLQSKDNLLAKLDVIATLLEGAPIAPALRMGDMTAKEVFVAASKREFGDQEGEILAEHTWDVARQHAVKRTEMAARALAGESGALLAREDGPSLDEREAINEKRRNFEAHIRDKFGVDSAVSRHLISAFGQFEDSERARLVTEHAWELQVRARVNEGRVGEENAKAQLREYLESQSDLLNRCGEFKELLAQHLSAAREEGRHLRERCDQSARDLRVAFEGLGTDEALVFSSLENRSQYELRIIRERYQEMYGEHVRDRLESELSGADLTRAMRAYQGDVANRGYAGRAISAEQTDALLVVNPEAAAQALLSGDPALLAALHIHDRLRDSGTSALVVAEIVRRSNLDGSALSAAEATLGLPSALEVLRARSDLSVRGDTEILVRRERCGVRIVESALRGEEISDELTTEYAALKYAAFGMQLGAAESQEAPNRDYLHRLQAEHIRFQDSLKGIFSKYPGLP
ncbi:MAG: hypothetical protein J0M12_17640, partial [Deltaproteobacteria bacterium]|nr:hypothetical protein [Deltaproteobacteria bacterium]